MTDHSMLGEEVESKVMEILLAVTDVSVGDYSTSIPVPDDDESPLAALCIGINEMIDALRERQAALDESNQKFTMLSEQSMMGMAIVQDGIVKYANESLASVLEYDRKQIESWPAGKILEILFSDLDDTSSSTNGSENGWSGETQIVSGTGLPKWVQLFSRDVVFDGREALYVTLADVTERKEAEELINSQASAIRELSTPILKLWDGVLALPVIGVVDTRRSAEIMEKLLSEITSQQAQCVILDITGVEVVDTKTADHFIKVVKAAQLLGTQCFITGIRPAVAQTLVDIGVDLSAIGTRSNLQSGLLECMQYIDRKDRGHKRKK